jgi:hypothetical protein
MWELIESFEQGGMEALEVIQQESQSKEEKIVEQPEDYGL